MFLKVIPPDCQSTRSSEEHSPQQQSEIEVEVLTAMAHLLPKEVCPVIGVEVTPPHTLTIPPGEARTLLLIRRLLIHILVVPLWVCNKSNTFRRKFSLAAFIH
ncbi:hypothetical protein AVEN_65030-1 [Araneus ventricosus]|uniref:Uncharacterized protein n=1 Tax=Araneus ventricosus TaxID=182803 RepID=A0A4Y2PRJ6_ARAVE|nr:hypothetical protein AVEN_5734-1 [Araneus ventricosus]GBN52708.1 hypothetical protein AVEN_33304-1 [Araneus ventricosus]GBN53822.1 hypothetical protein AVEN_199818-1 [Araneus ventricosus]GBN53829.1 hypothetical protein AVEN_65030-1 [Araneus ventricosus]